MDELKPASKGKGPTYDPTAETMKHDSLFSDVAPGIVSSGNLAHKWGAAGDHSATEAPPSGLKGD